MCDFIFGGKKDKPPVKSDGIKRVEAGETTAPLLGQTVRVNEPDNPSKPPDQYDQQALPHREAARQAKQRAITLRKRSTNTRLAKNVGAVDKSRKKALLGG